MPDIDTSMNRDPSPTRDELLALRDRMNARLEDDGRVRDYGRPVRMIHSANLLTRYWRQDVRFNEPKFVLFPSSGNQARFGRDNESDRCRALAETGERLGLERVGLIVETSEVSP